MMHNLRMDMFQQAVNRISAIELEVKALVAERADWQALLDAATKLGPRLGLPVQAKAPVSDTAQIALASNVKDTLGPVVSAIVAGSTARSTKKEQMLALAVRLLSGGRHMPAKQLADAMVANGIELGEDPTGYASVVLSRDGRFKSERAKGGWTLISGPNKEEAPQGVSAPAGPDLLDLSVPAKDTGTVAG